MNMSMEDFQVRPIFITRLLQNPLTATPLTGIEMDLATYVDVLLKIQEEIKTDLISFLRKNSPYVSLRDQLFFLLDCYEQDILHLAVETLEAAQENGLRMSAAGLVKIMQENSEYSVMPTLMVSLLGDEIEESELDPYQPPQPKKSALNLDAMRNFK